MNYLDVALRYHAAGHHVIPVNSDKRPTGPWKQYQAAQTDQDIRHLFRDDCWGIAILTGINGMEVIDVDEKHDPEKNIFTRYVKHNDEYSHNEAAVIGMVVQTTKNGGYHVIYRCPAIEGNQKLAMRPALPEELTAHNETAARPITDPDRLPVVLIETRGEGGYIVAHPSPGYDMLWGDFCDVPDITERQRYWLLQAARCFNEVIQKSAPDIQIERQQATAPANGLTPFDDYNAKTNLTDLMTSYGWEYVYDDSQRVHLRRPGNTDAKTSGNVHKGKNLFLSWSTSTPLEAGKGYSPAGVYAVYEHGGDFSAAAKALYAAGYGERYQPAQAAEPAKEQPAKPEERQSDMGKIIAFLKGAQFDITKPIREEAATLTLETGGKTYKIGGDGMIGGIVGAQKAGKSLLTSCLTASAMAGGIDIMGFRLAPNKGNMIYFDTEQPSTFFYMTQERIHHLAGKYSPVGGYAAYPMRRLSVNDRVRAIGAILHGRRDLGLIVIDGIVDLCENFNDERASAQTIEHLMRWSDETGAMILTVLHLTKADGFMRGHLGTALQNKYDFGIEVKKDKELDNYTVKCRESRFAPFPGFTFERDEMGFPYIPGALPFDPSLRGKMKPINGHAQPIAPAYVGGEEDLPF